MDVLLTGLLCVVGGLFAIIIVYGFAKLVSSIYDAIWALPEMRDELVKIRTLLEK